jgi:hypothetical protein
VAGSRPSKAALAPPTRRGRAVHPRGRLTRVAPSTLALGAICAGVLVLGVWNVLHYPPGRGYDGADHMAYADGLVPGGHLPPRTNPTFFHPPGYYAVAGSLDWVAQKLGIGEPHRAGMGLNMLLLLATVLLVWRIARELWPGEERLALGAAAFTALLPVTVKAETMFHPESTALFLCTLALWLCVRSFADGRNLVPLGLTLGAAQLVRPEALWTVGVVAVVLAVARRWRSLLLVVVLSALVAAPWYVHEYDRYGSVLVYPVPTPATPLLERRPARFYVDPGVPDVVTKPYRPNFLNLALPTTYTELWGDYFGVWAWSGRGTPSAHVRHLLQLQSIVGFVPTLLAVVGSLMFLLRSLRSPPRLTVALLPLAGILGYLYFAVAHPSPDGDDLKATYMLTATAGWALGFGYALERLRGRLLQATLAALVLCAVVELPFLVYA